MGEVYEEWKPTASKFGISDILPNILLRMFYMILKKDMVKKLREKHGEQFTDDVMETFGMSTNLMDEYTEKS